MHQAGSDSLLTAAVFFKMKQVQCKSLIEGEGFGFHVIRVRVCVCVGETRSTKHGTWNMERERFEENVRTRRARRRLARVQQRRHCSSVVIRYVGTASRRRRRNDT